MRKVLAKILDLLIPVAVFCIALIIVGSLVSSRPFGHDESVYLTKARSWLEGTPADQYVIYRPLGMVSAGWVLLHLGNSEIIIRSFGVVFGAITLLFIYLLFKKMFNRWVALGITTVVGTSTVFLREASQFFNDIPASGLLIGILLLLYIYYETAGKSKSVYFIALLSAFAFYLRYEVAPTLVVIGFLSLLILLPKFKQKTNASFTKLQTTLIVSIFLLIPHFLQSYIWTKDPFGILGLAGEVAGRKYIGDGLVDYIKWLPSETGGWVMGVTAILGIIATFTILARKKTLQNQENLLWLGGIGLLSFIIIGLTADAEPRHIFFSMTLLSGVGIASVYSLVKEKTKFLANLLITLLITNAVLSGVFHFEKTDSFFKELESDPYTLAFSEASNAISSDSASMNGCAIWSPVYRPTLSWYTKCNILPIGDEDRFERDYLVNSGKPYYSVVLTKLQESQISQNEAIKFNVDLTEVFRTNNLSKSSRGDLVVYRITRTDEIGQGNDWINW